MLEWFAELSENKIFTSVLPVVIGAGLLAWLFRLRDRQVVIRDESFKFVNEVADLLNGALSPLFGVLWRRDSDLEWVNKGIGQLFVHRLSTRAKSIGLLRAEMFSREYEEIMWRLRDCVDQLHRDLEKQPKISAAQRDSLGEPFWKERWNEAEHIWQRANALVIAGIERSLRGKPFRVKAAPLPPRRSPQGPRNE